MRLVKGERSVEPPESRAGQVHVRAESRVQQIRFEYTDGSQRWWGGRSCGPQRSFGLDDDDDLVEIETRETHRLRVDTLDAVSSAARRA